MRGKVPEERRPARTCESWIDPPGEQNDRRQVGLYCVASGPASACEGILFVAGASIRGILAVTRRAIRDASVISTEKRRGASDSRRQGRRATDTSTLSIMFCGALASAPDVSTALSRAFGSRATVLPAESGPWTVVCSGEWRRQYGHDSFLRVRDPEGIPLLVSAFKRPTLRKVGHPLAVLAAQHDTEPPRVRPASRVILSFFGCPANCLPRCPQRRWPEASD